MDTTVARPQVGQLLDGRYRVASHLADGGMATVYLGTDIRLERTVALKIMHAQLASDEDFVRRFEAEARSVARLSHPNVVTVYDQGADGTALYLAMEYVPGRTLRELLRQRGRLSPREALDIMDGVLAGLAAAHLAGIVHRDVKPENVLLGEDADTVKVADFGLARVLSGASHTKSGLIIGTAAYLAPEQVSGGTADARTDVYAAGVMLFEMLTGVQPHTGDSPLAVAYKHVNEAVPPPSSVVPGLPPALDALLALATSRDPELRPADAGQFLRAITGIRGGLPPAAVPLPAIPVSPAVSAADTLPPRPTASWGHDLIPGMGVPAVREPLGVLGGRLTQQLAPEPGGRGVHQTLVVSTGADAPYPGAGRGGPPGPREPRLQRLLYSRRLAYLALALAVVLVAGLLGWWTFEGRYTAVPSLTGMTAAAARAELANAGLTLAASRSQVDNQVAKGHVIRTFPAAGARIARGGRVTLLVSAGPRMIVMPQVSGEPLATAEAALRRAGLVPGKVKRTTSGTIAAGIVISTQPGSGVSWPQPDPVTLVVSAGPPVPNFVGQPKSAAESWAAQYHVQLNEVAAHRSDQPLGVVLRQSLPPGHAFTQGQVITIVYSPGPPMVRVPNVDGMPLGKAEHMLTKLGFRVTVNGFSLFRTVVGYSPQGSAPKGSTITLTVGFNF